MPVVNVGDYPAAMLAHKGLGAIWTLTWMLNRLPRPLFSWISTIMNLKIHMRIGQLSDSVQQMQNGMRRLQNEVTRRETLSQVPGLDVKKAKPEVGATDLLITSSKVMHLYVFECGRLSCVKLSDLNSSSYSTA
jgi:hypothetical protein